VNGKGEEREIAAHVVVIACNNHWPIERHRHRPSADIGRDQNLNAQLAA